MEKLEQEEHYKVPNLEKGIAILEYLANKGFGGASLQDIRADIEVSQTTAYRILNTLVRLGYLDYLEDAKRYRLSRKMLSVGFKSIGEHGLMEAVLPRLRTLRDRVKETVFFGVLGEDSGIFIDQAEGIYPFKFLLTPGNIFNLHSSAPGKALLAYLPQESRKRYLDKMDFTPFTQRTITNITDYELELEHVRSCGYATDMEEELIGVACVGAPIFDYTGMPCGAIWTSGPIGRFGEQTIAEVAPLVCEICSTISGELGYSK
ncbi:MAG: IclR family transcriptional regulator [Marinifilaceae bacterium]